MQRVNGSGGGFILLARKILDNPVLMNGPPLYLKLWIWILMEANWKDRGTLKRGQLVATILDMQKAVSWKVGYRVRYPTKDEIRSAYEAFTKATMITTMKTTRGMVITICNYDKYQVPENYEPHNEPHNEAHTKPTVTPHDTERRGKKGKKEREKNAHAPEKVEIPEWLDPEVWALYLEHRIAKKGTVPKRGYQVLIDRLGSIRNLGYDLKEVVHVMVERGWIGFDPSWNHGLKPKGTVAGGRIIPSEQFIAEERRELERELEEDKRRHPELYYSGEELKQRLESLGMDLSEPERREEVP